MSGWKRAIEVLPAIVACGLSFAGMQFFVSNYMGPELTDTYLRYRDRALTLLLRHPCTPRQPELGSGRYLEPGEAFALKAYLRDVALAAAPFATYPIAEAKRGTP